MPDYAEKMPCEVTKKGKCFFDCLFMRKKHRSEVTEKGEDIEVLRNYLSVVIEKGTRIANKSFKMNSKRDLWRSLCLS